MVRPSSIALRTFNNASSNTAFPEVRAVIESPSRIGTPEVISVPNVLVKRATAILRSKFPITGIFSKMLSVMYLPFGSFRICLMPKNVATSPRIATHQKFCTNWLSPMTMRVGKGRSTPRPANNFSKIGTTNLSSAPTTSTAMLITETG